MHPPPKKREVCTASTNRRLSIQIAPTGFQVSLGAFVVASWWLIGCVGAPVPHQTFKTEGQRINGFFSEGSG